MQLFWGRLKALHLDRMAALPTIQDHLLAALLRSVPRVQSLDVANFEQVVPAQQPAGGPPVPPAELPAADDRVRAHFQLPLLCFHDGTSRRLAVPPNEEISSHES